MDAVWLGVTCLVRLVPSLPGALSAVVLQERPPRLAVVDGVICPGGVGLTRRR